MPARPRRALEVVQSLALENGGTSVAIPALARATSRTGRYDDGVLHFSPPDRSVVKEGDMQDVLHRPCAKFDLLLPGSARTFLAEAVSAADVLQIHGIWSGHSFAALRMASRFGKPAIVSAHGMLDRWALRHSRWKKIPYSALVERRGLERATCFRALTRVEVENYRAFGLNAPVAVLPNGIAAPERVSPAGFLRQYPHLSGKKILLFLGRLHRKKGVDLLVSAWREVSVKFPDAHLVIAGPDDGAFDTLPAEASGSITVCGLLAGEMKWSALAAASAFTLPSFSEGLSMAILEALWMGLPVLITRECNFREIEPLECTFLIQPSVSSIAHGIEAVLRCTECELRKRGEVGAAFVRERYSWPAIGERMADIYDWMLGGSVPSSVEFFFN